MVGKLLITALTTMAIFAASLCFGKEPQREELLESLSHRSFTYFIEQSHPQTGLIADRSLANGQDHPSIVASSATAGFGLTALCIGDNRGWISDEEAYKRVLLILKTLRDRAQHERGFFYHFLDARDAKRIWMSEASSIDTALALGGVLTAKQYYPNTEAAQIAQEIYDRVDWQWMLDGQNTFSMGWTPESGFLQHRWDHYSEHLILQILALGSNTHPVSNQVWEGWERGPKHEFNGHTYLSYPPLFIHQYSHAWIDFRGRKDGDIDYWENSVIATKAHRQMFIDLSEQFPHYGPNLWGITSSDSPFGYIDWGGPPKHPLIDGTIVPCAAAGSLPFLPDETMIVLQTIRDQYADLAWTKYGFRDAFNPATGWKSNYVIGIDVGITLLMVENHRSGLVWKLFMNNAEIQKGIDRAGL